MTDFYTYAYGYKSPEAAAEALLNMAAEGEVSQAENPHLYSYRTKRGKRWAIRLQGTAPDSPADPWPLAKLDGSEWRARL